MTIATNAARAAHVGSAPLGDRHPFAPGGGARTDASAPGGSATGTHTVQRGDTLSAIAARHGTTWQRLAEINGLANPNVIVPGQVIRLPSGPPSSHMVRRGETLGAIAAAHGVGTAALARANGIRDPDLIHPGQVLSVPPTRAPTTRAAAPVAVESRSIGSRAPDGAGALRPGAASRRAADIAQERALPRSSSYCYRYVKQALQRSGAVADYLPGTAASGAGPALERRGFVNVLGRPGSGIRSPYDAPKGAVLVYAAAPGATDRNARYGHIEIRTGDGFASDYHSARARTGPAANGLDGRGRVLIGVYVKP